MTIIEPITLGGILSYVMTPVAVLALGFDPVMSWQYALVFGLLPLLFVLPAVLIVGFLFEVVSLNFFVYKGVADLAERIGLVLIVAGMSVGSYLAVSNWIHAPIAHGDRLLLAAAAPFIGGSAIALPVLAMVFGWSAFLFCKKKTVA